jgi:hypothetical protein
MRSTLNQTLFLPLGVNDVRGQRCPIKGTHLNLLVGKANTALLGLKPGDKFEIKLGRKQVRLIPVGGVDEEA